MSRITLAALLALCAGAASAQTPGPPPAGGATGRDDQRATRGAVIRIVRDDLAVTVRCAEGESTRSCGEIVVQLLEKLPPAPAGDRRYRESDRWRGGGWRDRDRDRDRDPD